MDFSNFYYLEDSVIW